MKCSKEIKNYITRHKQHLKDCQFDDLVVTLKQFTCKNWFKRIKKPTKFELLE